MKSWYHDKFNDFQTLFAFNRILKHFSHTFVRGHGSWARCSKLPSISWICPHIGLNNVNIIFRLIILHYSKHLQFKFDLSKKTIQLNKMIIYSKRRNIPKLNMEYHGQYVDSRKKSEGRINFFLKHFVVCSTWGTQQTNKTHDKLFELACVLGTRQKKWPSPGSYWGGTFAVCHASGTRQIWLFCRVLPVAVFFSLRHTTNMALLLVTCVAVSFLPCAVGLPCAFWTTLDKNILCHVPENLLTANILAHGKYRVSGSVCFAT